MPRPILNINLFAEGSMPDGQKPVGISKTAGWSPNRTRGMIKPMGHARNSQIIPDYNNDPFPNTQWQRVRYPNENIQSFGFGLANGFNILDTSVFRYETGLAFVQVQGFPRRFAHFADQIYWVASNTAIGVTKKATLGAAMNPSSTTVPTNDATALPTSGVVWFNNEFIRYQSKNGDNLETLTRGIGGSTAQSHAIDKELFVFDSTALSITNYPTTGVVGDQPVDWLVFGGALYGGYRRQLWRIEPGGVIITTPALLLGLEDSFEEMAEFNGSIIVSFSRQSNNKHFIGTWDGVSQDLTTITEVPGKMTGFFVYENILYGFINNALWQFNGSDFRRFDYIPGTDAARGRVNSKGVTVRKDQVLIRDDFVYFAPLRSATFNANAVPQGIYKFGRRNPDEPLAISCEYLLPVTNPYQATDIHCLGEETLFGTGMLFSYGSGSFNNQDGNFSNATVYDDMPAPYFITNPIDLSSTYKKLITGVQFRYGESFPPDSPFRLRISYRLDENVTLDDDTSNWTVLGSVGPTDANDPLYGIYERADRMQFKVELIPTSAESSGLTPTITGFVIH